MINTGSGDVINNNGYSIKQHEQRLNAEQKVAAITAQLTNLEDSYQKRLADLQSTITELQALASDSDVNDSKLNEAITAARQGDTRKAEALFKQIEEAAKKHVLRAAKAAF